MEYKIFKCEHCGNIIEMVKDTGVNVVCCGEKMKELVAGTTEASIEKHVPVVENAGDLVKVVVGSVLHPMQPEHYIEWVEVQTNKGVQRKVLMPNAEPVAMFKLCDDEKVEAVYAYCNLHGLWKSGN